MSWCLGYGSEVYPEVSVGKLASLDEESFWKLSVAITMTTSSIHSMLTMGFKYKSRSLERLLTFSAIQSSSF